MKTRGLPPPLTGQLFSRTLRVPGSRGQNPVSWTGCRAGGGGWGQLGEAERGSGGRRRPASGSGPPPPSHGPQREGRWPMGNWAMCAGQLEPQLRTGLSPDGVRGCGRVCWGRAGSAGETRAVGPEDVGIHRHRLQGTSCPSPRLPTRTPQSSHPTAAPEARRARKWCWIRPRT